MDADRIMTQAGGDLPGADPRLWKVVIPDSELNKFGLRRKSGSQGEPQEVWLFLVNGKYYYDYKFSGVLRKAAKAVTPGATG